MILYYVGKASATIVIMGYNNYYNDASLKQENHYLIKLIFGDKNE